MFITNKSVIVIVSSQLFTKLNQFINHQAGLISPGIVYLERISFNPFRFQSSGLAYDHIEGLLEIIQQFSVLDPVRFIRYS